jgi:N-acetylneuraminic acid mutarotase
MGDTTMMRSLWIGLLVCLLIPGCGGGGDGSTEGGGGSQQPFTISASSTSLLFNGVARVSGSVAAQTLTITFSGSGLRVSADAGQVLPPWLTVTVPANAISPAAVEVRAGSDLDVGSYTTVLHFTTTRANGADAASIDVPIALVLTRNVKVSVVPAGLPSGSTFAVTFNTGAPQVVATGQPTLIGIVAPGSTFSAAVVTQPTGQTCRLSDGQTTNTTVLAANTPDVSLRVTCNAALIPWTWIGGSMAVGGAANYGVRGVPDPSNTPGSRQDAASARDASGNLWVFGGIGPDGSHNDLWRYDIAAGLWTWMSGASRGGANGVGINGVYGVRGTPSTQNLPGSRSGAAAWFDSSGKFWVFGGNGYSSIPGPGGWLNDLWRYDPQNGTWTWVGGSSTGDFRGVYGAGPSPANIPGARANAAVVSDSHGAIWLFGGDGAGVIASFGPMNDLWKFVPATGEWTWVAGSSEPMRSGTQGILGVPASTNDPSGRVGAAAWIDANGDFWMFGGYNLNLSMQNDLWRFKVNTSQWTWMGGTDRSTFNNPAGYGTYGSPLAAGNYPTNRAWSSSWTDAAGNFWLFGGWTSGQPVDGPINDLWRYSPSTAAWSWLSGSSVVPTLGVTSAQGAASTDNAPAGRQQANAWTDNSGRLWLWGGAQGVERDALSDVWRATPP